MFDNITYTKGGAVLGMLEQWLGEETFRRGLASYIADRQYSNATAGDLWFHLARASGLDVAALARSWTDRPGLPVVQVDSRCQEQGNAGSGRVTVVSLRQDRLRAAVAGQRQVPAAPWQIPLRIVRGAEAYKVVLSDRVHTLQLPGCSTDPVVVNAGGVAYVRVHYGDGDREALQRRFADLADIDQVWFFSDQWALAQLGVVPVAQWLALLHQLPRLDSPARSSLWAQAVQGLRTLDQALAGQAAQAELRAATRALLAPELARLGWTEQPGEDSTLRQLRASLIERLAACDHGDTVAQALRRVDEAHVRAEALPGSTRGALLKVAGQHGQAATFERLMAMFLGAQAEEERWLFATALASSRVPSQLQQLLAASLDPAVPPNVALALPGLVSSQSPHGALAYDFVLRHWSALSALAGQAVWGRQWLLPEASAGFNTVSQAQRLRRDQRAPGRRRWRRARGPSRRRHRAARATAAP